MPGLETATEKQVVRPVHDLTRSPTRTDTTLAANLPESLRYRVKRVLLGPPLVSDRAPRPATGQAHGPGRAVLGRHVVLGLRQRGDAADPGPHRRAGGLLPRHADDGRHPGRPGRGDHLLPRRGPLLPEGGRLLRGEPRQLRAERRPDRRRRPAHQLHDHRGRVGGGRRRRHHLGRPALGRYAVPLSIAFVVLLAFGNLRGHPRGRAGLRHPDLLLHRQHGRAHRRSAWPRRPPATSPGHAEPRDAAPRPRQRRAHPRRLGLLPAAGLRQRQLGHDRHRGHLQRREHLPGAPGPQRPHDPRAHEHHPRGDVPRRLRPGRPHPLRALRLGHPDGGLGDRQARLRLERRRRTSSSTRCRRRPP